MQLTSKERFTRILKHQPVDRIGLFEVFWRETAEKWSAEGHFAKPEMISDHFGLDVRRTGGDDKKESERLYTWSGLFGTIALMEAGFMEPSAEPV
jgi:hypothetical protein